MKIAEYVGNNIVTIELHDRLTVETAQGFLKAIAKRLNGAWPGIILDLQHVDYMDSAGLGALICAYTICQEHGTRLVFVRVSGKNLELLTITKLLTVFEVYETTLEAERSLRATAATERRAVGGQPDADRARSTSVMSTTSPTRTAFASANPAATSMA